MIVVKGCGSCVFKKEEDLYPDDYMIELYGDLHCCDSKCKDKKDNEIFDSKGKWKLYLVVWKL